MNDIPNLEDVSLQLVNWKVMKMTYVKLGINLLLCKDNQSVKFPFSFDEQNPKNVTKKHDKIRNQIWP